MDCPKLQEKISELCKDGKGVAFQSWNNNIRISINTVDKNGKPLSVAEQFTPEDLKKMPMHELLSIVQRKLNE
jgi:hypothetical protein